MTAKQPAKPRRKRHPARWLSFALAAALCIVIFLPVAVNRTVNQMLRNATASGVGTFQLHQIGLTRSSFSVAFAPEDQPGPQPAHIDSCVLQYRPLRLLRGKIDAVNISGFSLLVSVTNGTVKIPAITLFTSPKSKAANNNAVTLKTLRALPISIATIRLDGYVLLDMQTERQAIPIQLQVNTTENGKWGQIACSANASLASAQLSATLLANTITETLTATLSGNVSTEALPYTLRQKLPEAIKHATGTIDAHTGIQLNGASLSAFTCKADLEVNATTTIGDIVCSPHINIQGDTRRIEGSASGINAQLNDLPLKLSAPDVVWLRNEKTLDGHIRLHLADNTPLSIDIHADPDGVQARIPNSTNGWSGAVDIGGLAVTWAGARLTATGGARAPTALLPPLFATFSLDELTFKNATSETLIQLPDGLSGHAEIETAGAHITANAAFSLPNTVFPKQALAIRDAALYGASSLNPDGQRRLDANLQAQAAFRDVEIAALDANLWQPTPKSYLLSTSVNALGITGHVASVISTAPPQGFVMSNTLAISEQTLDLRHVSQIFPETDGITFSGNIAADAHYTLRPSKHEGAITGQFTKGAIKWPEKKLSASDIHLTVNLPALPTLRSRAQFFGFKNLKLGRMVIDSGIAIFRIQDRSIWYLNNLVLNGCGGKIRGESTRISRGDEKTRITLHANHILLPELLEQLGIGTGSEEGGRMNGSLPILIENGRITVADGFLHSTPGVKSRIKLIPTARLQRTAATSIELALAIDALSDFTYSWLRLSVNSNEEDLNIKFEMDGRPAKKLYYTLSDGTLIETRHANTFKGISLDSTFRLPLNEILTIAKPFTDPQRSTERK